MTPKYNASLLNAKYILLTGMSAGGIGTFMNVDWLYTEMSQKSKYGDNITVKAAPIAGFFFPGNTTDQLSSPWLPPNDYPHWVQGENGGEVIMILWMYYGIVIIHQNVYQVWVKIMHGIVDLFIIYGHLFKFLYLLWRINMIRIRFILKC